MRIEVPAEAAGERLDVFLAAHAGSRAAAQRLIDGGLVRVDGEERVKRHALRGGEVIEVEEEPEAAVADVPDAQFSIAWEDEHLLVVDKPAGVVVHPARGHAAGTLAQALEPLGAAGGPEGRRGIVHRLDRDTSGLLVVARSEDVHAQLQAALAGAPDPARVPRARRGPPERPHGHDRGAARPRPPGAHPHVDRHRRRARRGHALRDRAGARGLHAAAGAARDRPHAPDPRAPEGDRAPGGRRSRVRPRRRCSASSASSCTPSGSRSTTPSPASASTSARRSPRTSRAAL